MNCLPIVEASGHGFNLGNGTDSAQLHAFLVCQLFETKRSTCWTDLVFSQLAKAFIEDDTKIVLPRKHLPQKQLFENAYGFRVLLWEPTNTVFIFLPIANEHRCWVLQLRISNAIFSSVFPAYVRVASCLLQNSILRMCIGRGWDFGDFSQNWHRGGFYLTYFMWQYFIVVH